jgi:hypothetical protein
MSRSGGLVALFAPLRTYLGAQDGDACVLSFTDLETIIGAPLPMRYRTDTQRWTDGTKAHVRQQRVTGVESEPKRRGWLSRLFGVE